MIRLALFEPEIAQNTGTLLRLGACLGVELDIIDPCGFGFSDQTLKRSGMDYIERQNYKRHACVSAFFETALFDNRRLIYLTPGGRQNYLDFSFSTQDTLILGRESTGIPTEIAQKIPHHLKISMQPNRRSLNVAIAGAMVLGEALRQLR